MSNLLAMPLIEIGIETFNNQDWLDSIEYVVVPNSNVAPDPSGPQLDLRGISFTMEVRVNPGDHDVVLTLSSSGGSILVGLPPNFGFLIFYLPVQQMKYMAEGNYVADLVGTDGNYQRTVASVALTIVEGITR